MSWRGLPPWSDKEAGHCRMASDWPDSTYAREAAAPVAPDRLAHFRDAYAAATAAFRAGRLRAPHEMAVVAAVADDACAAPAAALRKCAVARGAVSGADEGTDGAVAGVGWAGFNDARPEEVAAGASPCAAAPQQQPRSDGGSVESAPRATINKGVKPTASVRVVNGVNVDRVSSHCTKRLLNYGRCLQARLGAYLAEGGHPEINIPSLGEAGSVALVAPRLISFTGTGTPESP